MTRAAAVVRGELVGRPFRNGFGVLTRVDVPQAYRLILASDCYYARPAVTPSCAPPFRGGRRLVSAPTYEFRNPPVYYAVVGWPSLIWPAALGVYLMRVVSALLCAALLASALTAVRSLPAGGPRRGGVLGVIVASTPMVWYLAGVVNPSSLEVAAAICLWASLAVVVLSHQPVDRRAVSRCGVACVALVVSRGLSPAFAVIAVGSMAALAGGDRLRVLWRRRDLRRWAGAVVGATVAAVAWTAWIEARFRARFTGIGLARGFGRTWPVLRQAIGVLGSLDLPLPWPVYALWALAGLAALAAGLASGRRGGTALRPRVVLLALTAVAVFVPATSTGADLPPIGFGWQGRFGLPLLDGVVILAFVLVGAGVPAGSGAPVGAGAPVRAGAPASRSSWRRATVFVLAALGGSHVVAFVTAGRRYGVGSGRGQSVFGYLRRAGWHPPVPAPLLLGVFAAAVAGLVTVVIGRGNLSAPDPGSEDRTAIALGASRR